MYGAKRILRLLSGIYGTVLSGLQFLGVIVLMFMYWDHLGFEWLKIMYLFMTIMAVVILLFSASLCSNKSPENMAIAVAVFAGLILLFNIFAFITNPDAYAIINILLFTAQIIFCCAYLSIKEEASTT